ncbi:MULTISPECIES: helix-turn-helix domain-containing protein [unclassified Nocardioides]|uniref:helix-turn-helix domain-containing protein n=1 Tax=unclassified Nocardioides TaxID=2615069 RepID=UPI0026662AF3|nr:XRE family transcriptional regulator [Nocardioides sp. Arc9.136]WKN48935.1 XRE family transcriptional regulator [Nocardioides sp. Arc9.136]
MLGDRLRELRQKRGLTLKGLAAQAEVSVGLLSQIENGTTDPSLATLRKLSAVFDAEIASLFTEPNAPLVYVSRPGQRTTISAPQGRITYERLTPGRGELEVLRADLAPGDTSSAEPRGHASTECVLVLGGTVRIEVGEATYDLVAGEAVTFDSRLPHRFSNVSDEPASITVSVTPPVP